MHPTQGRAIQRHDECLIRQEIQRENLHGRLRLSQSGEQGPVQFFKIGIRPVADDTRDYRPDSCNSS